MPIVPDTKSWTWVLDRRCPECGFDASRVAPCEVAGILRESITAWAPVLARPGVRERPDDSTWSSLEYAAHVRDVFRVFLGRVRRARAEDDPLFDDWDQDAAAVAGRYGELDPADVERDLAAAGDELVRVLASVRDDEWGRPCRRSDGSVFTLGSLVRYTVHDPVHHLWDVSGRPER